MDTVTSQSHGRLRPLWSSAPPLIGWPLAACYGLLLVPAITGAVFEWRTLLTIALLVPGFVLQMRLGYTAACAYGIPRRTFVVPSGTRILFGIVAGILGVLVAHIRPTYLAPLGFVLVLILIADPVWRIAWNRARTPVA